MKTIFCEFWRTFGGTVKDLKTPKPEEKDEYKHLVKERYDKIRLPSAIPGELEDLEASYTELLIVRKFWGKERQELRRSSGVGCLQQMSSLHEEDPEKMTISKLFDPDKKGRIPQTIILHGAAGTGKTYTVRKILLDWASEKIYEDLFDFVFYIDCKELLKKKEEVTLTDLLWHTCGASKFVLQKALTCQEKILFLVDGVDELFGHITDENSSNAKIQSWPTSVTIAKLLKRDHAMVQRAKILLTTRSLCLYRVEKELTSANLSAEVLGFLEEGIKDYFNKLVLDQEKAMEIYNYIRDNEMIFTMCFVPALSWVVCNAVMSDIDDAGNLKTASTTTQVFLSFVITLLKNHCPEFQKQHHSILEKLGVLALRGIRKQQFSFDQEDMDQVQQDLPEKIQSIFLNSIFEKKIIPETQCGFTHTIVQEFIAALYYFSSTRKEEMKDLLEDTLKTQDPHKVRIVRFLFGLGGQKARTMLKNFIGMSTVPSLMKDLLCWVKKASSIDNNGYFQRELLHCLYELQHEQSVKQALEDIKTLDLSRATLGRLDCSVLKFCLSCCPCLDQLDLPDAPLGQKELEILLPELHRCQNLKLSAQKLSEEFAKQVCIQLSSKLCLWDISLEGEPEGDGVLLYFQAARITKQCRLTVYYLREEFLLDFCQCLNSFINLTDIRIHDTSLGSIFLEKLSKVLSICKLETLRFSGNGLTKGCIKSLISFLRANPVLKEFYLGRNGLGDDGVIQLLMLLPQMCCRLQELSIMSNGLTKQCMLQLCITAAKCQALDVLDLDNNRLGDEGVKNLCPLLTNPDCKLRTLVLSHNNLTDACLESLVSALRHNTTLKLLNLSSNYLTHHSVPMLQSMWKNSLCIYIDENDIPDLEKEKFSRPAPQSRWGFLNKVIPKGLGAHNEPATSEKPGQIRKNSISKLVPRKLFRSSGSGSTSEWSSSLDSECMESEPKVYNTEQNTASSRSSSITSSRTEDDIRDRKLAEDLLAAETKIRKDEGMVEHRHHTDDCGISNTPEAPENPSSISESITSSVTSEMDTRGAVQVTQNALTTDMKEGDLKKIYGKISEEISHLRHENSQHHQEIMDSLRDMSRALYNLENLCQKILVKQQELHDEIISPPASSKGIQSSGTLYTNELFLEGTLRPPDLFLTQPTSTEMRRRLQRSNNQDIPDT
ncbi:NACHT, LRR and PYD domains-containing protein 3 isoform X2 [Microcaecilia unicolor]|uniref:NACHT, LRR and PYD domains-containing protein 3-like isoform X2 n=1 Tax=Microcaecilia unicolor TaxID=1415580 RepID=A0A6P7XFA4_9AMPH|nr:NACHT, LRR and PYD domains-containing protein 3-like isoform X2 [Microcaecilia unicolor]